MDPHPSRQSIHRLFRAVRPLQHLYLMGGFAEDALLDGKVTRSRGDADFLVRADAWDEARAELRRIGITRLQPLLTGPEGEPIAFASDERRLPVEVWSATWTATGYAIVLPGEAGFFRLRLPDDTFDFGGATLDGVAVRTISPRALALLRAASAQTRGDAAARAGDRRALRRLADEAMAGSPAVELIPEIIEFPGP